ncbi:hypothetical protein ACU4GR_25875 [Methylobacterium oryzae CBMB20]
MSRSSRHYVGDRQAADLLAVRVMASAGARKARTSALFATIIVSSAVLASAITEASPVGAQIDLVAMTPPSCETYQRERPRGGPREQLSQLFGLSIYRWDEADYARYRELLLDCKRVLLDFHPDLTAPQWQDVVDRGVANLKIYTGYVNRLGEPMASKLGRQLRHGQPDSTFAFEALPCDRFSQATVGAWGRGGAPGFEPEAPFGVPVAAWTYEVWRAFENRVIECGRQSGSAAEADADWMRAVVVGMEGRAVGEIWQARQEATARATKLDAILGRLAEAERLSTADDFVAALQDTQALAAAGPKLGPADEEHVATARAHVTEKLRTARVEQPQAWERDRPAREARERRQGRSWPNSSGRIASGRAKRWVSATGPRGKRRSSRQAPARRRSGRRWRMRHSVNATTPAAPRTGKRRRRLTPRPPLASNARIRRSSRATRATRLRRGVR